MARDVAAKILPASTFSRIQAVRSRNHQRRLLDQQGLLRIGLDFTVRYGRRVLNGPFRGMEYSAQALEGRHAVPKLLGSYELELQSIIERVQRTDYDRIIDIGCAEGYYAVGFALTTRAQIYAFDTEPRERRLCRQMAAANGVADRIFLNTWCNAQTLVKVAVGRTFILADCEGYEVDLFDEGTARILSNADLLIEAHDSLVPGASATIQRRFKRSHDAEVIVAKSRDGADFPELTFLGHQSSQAVSEYRDREAQWIYLQAKDKTPCL